MKTTARGLGDLDVNIFALDRNWIDSNARARNMNGATSRRIELPTVPRADELAIVDDTGSERAAAMRTHVIHRGKPTSYSGDAELFAITPEFLRGAFRGHLAH